MMFRKLYWVTEGVNRNEQSTVLGVYTSIPDLIRTGLSRGEKFAKTRISLVKLDSPDSPLGTWESPDYAGLADALQTYIATDEFSADQCESLLRSTRPLVAA